MNEHPIFLSPHFSTEEMLRSSTAERAGFLAQFSPPPHIHDNLQRLCNDILEPAREILASPLIITSGYRCPELNSRIGGAKYSAHLDGRAADFRAAKVPIPKAVQILAESQLPFDQLIHEGSWIHISIPASGDPRRQVLRAVFQGGVPTYSKWTT